MNKCFITKLPSSVDNDNLPVLGQLRINWLKQSELTDNDARAIGLSTNDSITVKVSGAHLTDNTLSSNLGNSKTITKDNGLVWLYVSNDADAVMTIDNKYSLTALTFVKPGKETLKRSVYFDINDIKYCIYITDLEMSRTSISGDISAVRNLTAINTLNLCNTSISGDISAVRNLTAINTLNLGNTLISGDISAISNLTTLASIVLNKTQISGDIGAVRNLINLVWLDLQYTQISGDVNAVSNLIHLTGLILNNIKVSGDISALNKLTHTLYVELDGIQISGDMSKIPTNWDGINLSNRKINTNFTWTAKGRQNATFLAIHGGVPFDTASMDNMLIDQATCTLKASGQKILEVHGTRTSASDAAVTTLQNMGITIIGVTKQA